MADNNRKAMTAGELL